MEPSAYNVAQALHVVGAFNPVYISLFAICAHRGAIFQSGERDQDCFVDMLHYINLWHDSIKGKQSHLGCVFRVALLPWTWHLPLGIH